MGRPLRGSRLASFYSPDTEADPIAPPSLSTLDSAFQLQEYIGAVVRLDPHDIDRIVKVPGRNTNPHGDEKEKEVEGEEERVSIDEACWIYEQLRRLAQDLTHPLITMLQQECTRQTCPEMKAGEWLYLCVAHGNSGAMEHCCAIDYIVHTLDSATALLNSPRAFPSRISIPQTSHRHFPSLARRLGRIFAHAYYHHRLAFESAEAESALYARFLALSRHFDLVPAEFLVIPERNEQSEEGGRGGNEDENRKNMTLLTRDHEDPISLPPSAIPTTSPSPRIGGRSRTDTMYLSGGYASPHSRRSPVANPSPSPQRIPSPMATTLAADVNQNQEILVASSNDVTEGTVTQGGDRTVGALEQERTDRVEEQAPDTMDGAALTRTLGQVIARDFALEALLPITVREPPEDGAETTNAPIEDVPYHEEAAETKTERDDTSSCLETSGDAPDLALLKPDSIPTVPSDPADPTPAPSYSDNAVAEPLLPVMASHMAESQAPPEDPVEENVEPVPHEEAPSDQSGNEKGSDAFAEDERKGGDEVKEEEIAAEIETLTQGVDTQQETGEGNVDENFEKPLESEDT